VLPHGEARVRFDQVPLLTKDRELTNWVREDLEDPTPTWIDGHGDTRLNPRT
jgi:hypothetical protein